MPLSSSDIQFRYSNVFATSGDSDGSDPPIADLSLYCLGRHISSFAWNGGSANDLFDNISGIENVNNQFDVRCIFVANVHPSITLYNAIVYLPQQVAGGASVSIGLERTIVGNHVRFSQIDDTSEQAITCVNETSLPGSVSYQVQFYTPTVREFALPIGDIPPGQCTPIWIRRQATNSAAMNADGMTIRIEGDNPQ